MLSDSFPVCFFFSFGPHQERFVSSGTPPFMPVPAFVFCAHGASGAVQGDGRHDEPAAHLMYAEEQNRRERVAEIRRRPSRWSPVAAPATLHS